MEETSKNGNSWLDAITKGKDHPLFVLCLFGLAIAGLIMSDAPLKYRIAVGCAAIVLALWCFLPEHLRSNITGIIGLLIGMVMVVTALVFALAFPWTIVSVLIQYSFGIDTESQTGWVNVTLGPLAGPLYIGFVAAFWWMVYKVMSKLRHRNPDAAATNLPTPTG